MKQDHISELDLGLESLDDFSLNSRTLRVYGGAVAKNGIAWLLQTALSRTSNAPSEHPVYMEPLVYALLTTDSTIAPAATMLSFMHPTYLGTLSIYAQQFLARTLFLMLILRGFYLRGSEEAQIASLLLSTLIDAMSSEVAAGRAFALEMCAHVEACDDATTWLDAACPEYMAELRLLLDNAPARPWKTVHN